MHMIPNVRFFNNNTIEIVFLLDKDEIVKGLILDNLYDTLKEKFTKYRINVCKTYKKAKNKEVRGFIAFYHNTNYRKHFVYIYIVAIFLKRKNTFAIPT